MSDSLYGSDIPMGLGMALMQNQSALQKYAALSDERKKEIIDGCRGVSSKKEMQSYVNSLAELI